MDAAFLAGWNNLPTFHRAREMAMAFADLPLVGMLKTRMRWLESRQKILSENVANAETPGYRERDLRPLDFK